VSRSERAQKADEGTSPYPRLRSAADRQVTLASVAGVSERTLYRAVKAGTVPTVRLTSRGRIFVPRKALERLLGGLSEDAGA
jgi:hypothetical protein